MRVFFNILYTVVMVVGLAMVASAQRDDGQKKPPPKPGNPPVITPQPKNPPPDKPKKPGYALVVFKVHDVDEMA